MPPPKRIVLVNHLSKEREELAVNLERAGYLLIRAEDGALAMNKSIVDPPDMIITNAAMPLLDGFKLCQLLRTNPATKHIPFIFITDKETNPKKLGQFIRPDDDFILRPFKIEELLGRVHNLFYRLDKVQEVSQEADRSVAGTLTEIALVDLLQIFKMNRKNGVLSVRSDNQTGSILIKEGGVIDAKLGRITGEKAIYRLITWPRGTFEFKPAIIEGSVKIQQPTENLVMEGLRQMDELNRMKDRLLPRKSLITLRKTLTGDASQLKPITREILHLLEFFHRVEDILDNSSYPDLEVHLALLSLKDHEVIELSAERESAATVAVSPLLSLEEALKIGYYLGVGRGDSNQRWVGKILIFSRRGQDLEFFLSKAEIFPEFNRESYDLFGDEQSGCNTGVKASIGIMDNITLLLVHLPPLEGYEPLWRTFHYRAIGALLITDAAGETSFGPVAAFLKGAKIPFAGISLAMDEAGTEVARQDNGVDWKRLDPSEGEFSRKALRSLFESILSS
jgi:CheY-like chemotaxis protein